jgi:hypothetical protein
MIKIVTVVLIGILIFVFFYSRFYFLEKIRKDDSIKNKSLYIWLPFGFLFYFLKKIFQA